VATAWLQYAMAKSSIFKARLKVVTVLVDRQLYGSEFQNKSNSQSKEVLENTDFDFSFSILFSWFS